MPGRSNTPNGQRYQYQGQESEEEIDALAFELRLYEPWLGRWQSPDPYAQHHSPYLAMSNNPVSFVDPNGGIDMIDKDEANRLKMMEIQARMDRAKQWSVSREGYGSSGRWNEGEIGSYGAVGANGWALGDDDYYAQVEGLNGRWISFWIDQPGKSTGKSTEITSVLSYRWESFGSNVYGAASGGSPQEEEGSWVEDIWNSYLVRNITGDALAISINIDYFLFGGASTEPLGVIMTLRGPDAFQPMFVADAGGGFGMPDIGVSAKFAKFRFLGDVDNNYLSNYHGPRMEFSASFGEGLVVGVGGAVAKSQHGYINSGFLQLGAGVLAPFPFSANINFGGTGIWNEGNPNNYQHLE